MRILGIEIYDSKYVKYIYEVKLSSLYWLCGEKVRVRVTTLGCGVSWR